MLKGIFSKQLTRTENIIAEKARGRYDVSVGFDSPQNRHYRLTSRISLPRENTGKDARIMRTVLVVEDDFDTLHPLAELLRLKGYTVNTATEAEQGLAVAREQRPDLIITDIALPGRSGLQFIGAVRKEEEIKSTPIIVISGCGPMILVEAEAAGANCCLEKPISIELFWAAIDQVFGAVPERELPKPVDWREDPARALAGEIDGLVETLRHCTTKTEREEVLKRLKERILKLQARNATCA